ncbi:MAG: DUF3558 family protein [Candidatus Limnocylindrales bacterium]
MQFPRVLFFAVPAVLALAGCGGTVSTPTAVVATAGADATGSTPTAAATAAPTSPPAATQVATAVDLCGLLTAGDLSTVLGGSWAEGQLTSTGGYCHWDSGSQPNDQVITATDARTLEAIKSAAAGSGTDMTVAGHAGYSVRSTTTRLQSTYVDLGGKLLLLEFGTSSSSADDQAHAQALAEIAVGKM